MTDKEKTTLTNQELISLYGDIPMFYVKRPQNKDRPSFHIHIDSQAIFSQEITEKLVEVGFVPDDFAHDFRIGGVGGDPEETFPHFEPIHHMTFKTSEPSDFYRTWDAASSILKKVKVLEADETIATGLRGDAKNLQKWDEASNAINYIKTNFFVETDGQLKLKTKSNVAENPALLKKTVAALKDVNILEENLNPSSLEEVALAVNNVIELPYYLEGELLQFDKKLKGSPFNKARFEEWFPKLLESESSDFAIKVSGEVSDRESFMQISKRRLDPESKGSHEKFRSVEVHITMQQEGTDPMLLEIMGHLGFSGPAIPKYILAEDGKSLVTGDDGNPTIIHDIPFTIQALNLPKLRQLTNAVVTMLEEVGGFEQASVKLEPILSYEVTDRVDYSEQMPPILETLELRPDILHKLLDRGDQIKPKADGPIGSMRYSNKIKSRSFLDKLKEARAEHLRRKNRAA